MPANLENSAAATGKGQFSFQSQRKAMPKNVQTTTQLHSFDMLKILQASLQQYMNQELPDVQAGFRKGRGTRDQISNICWIIEKARVTEKHLLLLYCGLKIAGRNINNLRYADDTSLMVESEEELETFDESERGE